MRASTIARRLLSLSRPGRPAGPALAVRGATILLVALLAPGLAAQTPVWTARYDSPLEDGQAGTDFGCRNVAADALGNAYVLGYAYTGTNRDYLVSKYDSSGALLWAQTYNGPANSEDYACGLAVDGGACQAE